MKEHSVTGVLHARANLPMSDSKKDWNPPTPAELQKMLPQYEVEALWGRGGMGAVYKGRQKSLHRSVAIKVLPEDFGTGEDDPHQYVERFKLEARAMATLDHPAILSVHDFGQTENGQLYIVMEFIDGMDIYAYLQHHGGKLPHEHAIAICSHVLDALQYAHDSGVIHRDIKPSNVMINSQGRVKLCDFGLAKRITQEDEDSAPPLTMPDMAMGTPDFVAPETLDPALKADGRADLYAVGVMLYQLLTGKLPRGQFELPSEMLPEIDPRFDGVVTRALQANPDSRYGSATEFRGDLNEILSRPIPKAADPTSAEIPLAQLAESSAPKVKVRGKTRKPTTEHAAPVAAASEAQPEKKTKAPPWIGVGLAAALLIGIGVYAITRPGDNGKGPGLATVEPSAPGSPAAPEPEPVPEKPPELEPEKPAQPPTPAPTEPPTTATPATPKPTEPDKPEPTPEPAKPEPATPDHVPSTTPPKPEEKPESAGEQLAAVPGLKKRLDGYLTARRTAIEELAASYLRGLDGRMNHAADAGDLKLTKAYRGEKALVEELQKELKEKIANPVEAVGQGATLPPLAADAPDELGILRKIWTTERQKIRTDLDGKLQVSLRTLESDLTKARKLEQAELVLAYREGLDGKPQATVASAPEPAKPAPATPDPASATNTAMASHRATKEQPFENSLGMRFVPVPITGGPSDGKLILFSIWETRVRDYEEFIEDERGRKWVESEFEQGNDHPAINVSWDDGVAFCNWLTTKDRRKGKIGKVESYRLPSDHEWSCAVGINSDEDAEEFPSTKDAAIKDAYPWGNSWPPPTGIGNFYGEEALKNPIPDLRIGDLAGYHDGYERTSPVGIFLPNHFGLHDLAGNVSEWCHNWYSPAQEKRVLRGSSIRSNLRRYLLSSLRFGQTPEHYYYSNGFRVVLDTGVAAPSAPTSVTQTPPAPPPSQIDRAALQQASKERPFVNSLGMKFVPVPGTDVLFCIHETRRRDYAVYSSENPSASKNWVKPSHNGIELTQTEIHPVTAFSWEDCKSFCEWITVKEGLVYRLPTDREWSVATGMGRRENRGQLRSN